MKSLLTLTLAGFLLASCAGKADMQTSPEKRSYPSSAKIEGVPFFAQQSHLCGPAALSMALNQAGIGIDMESITPKLYVPELRGSLQVEMVALPRRYGAISYRLQPTPDALFMELAAGHPVVVLQNLGLQIAPQWHYAIATAYDLKSEHITLHSGDTRDYQMKLSTFMHTWERSDNWAMLTLAAGDIPATANEADYLKAVANLERTGFHNQALVSYKAAAQRWPQSVAARIGIGNTLYALGELDAAANSFRNLIDSHPEVAPAYNNLAQIYLEQQRFELALATIQTAIIKDNASPVYHQTWREIIAQQQQSNTNKAQEVAQPHLQQEAQ